MSTEKLTTPTTTDSSLSPSIKWHKNTNFCLIFQKSCLKQKKRNAIFTPPNILIFFFIAYNLDAWSRDLNSNFILKDCWFGGVKLDKNADPDKFYDVPLHALEGLPSSPNLKVPFSWKSLSFDELSAILATRRNASCPGLNAIPYKVYKQCTQIRRFLFNIFCSCLKHSVVPLQWRYAMEHYIPKTKSPCPSNIKDFRPIALMNVEGSCFSV